MGSKVQSQKRRISLKASPLHPAPGCRCLYLSLSSSLLRETQKHSQQGAITIGKVNRLAEYAQKMNAASTISMRLLLYFYTTAWKQGVKCC